MSAFSANEKNPSIYLSIHFIIYFHIIIHLNARFHKMASDLSLVIYH